MKVNWDFLGGLGGGCNTCSMVGVLYGYFVKLHILLFEF